MEEIKRHTAIKQNYVTYTIHHLIKYKIKEILADYQKDKIIKLSEKE